MRKQEFTEAILPLEKGDRVRIQLREDCFKRTPDFDGSFAGSVIERSSGLLCLAIKREGLKWFTFYPVESVTRLSRAKEASV